MAPFLYYRVIPPKLTCCGYCRFKTSPVNSIFCQALAGSPLRPQRLTQLDKEREEQLKPPFGSAAENREVETWKGEGGFCSHLDRACLFQEEASPVKGEASTHKPITVPGQAQVAVGTTHISRLTDDQLIKEFLSGSYCLHGVSRLSRRASARISAQDLSDVVLCSRVLGGGSMNSAMGSTSTSIMR